MKTRVKKKHFGTVKDTDLIGIEWGNNTKGLLIETKSGVQILNATSLDTKNSIISESKTNYLKDTAIKKVFIFDNKPEMLKWFAKK